MKILSLSPMPAASIPWQPAPSLHALTVVCKATFALLPGVCVLATEQEDIHEREIHFDDDKTRSLYAPNDLVPTKPRADVLLVGNAYAPRGEPVHSLVVRLLVGTLDKSIEVLCPRIFTRDGALRDGARWTKMPLRYERASGGLSTWNPVGIDPDGPPDPFGQRSLPNLQPPGLHVTQRSDIIGPIGFGPIASTWVLRSEKLGRGAEGLSDEAWARSPLGQGFDQSFFQAAPPDQQVDEIRADERIILEHLLLDHTRLVTRLPGVRPRAFVELNDATSPQDIAMKADTLWIDTDKAICTVTWRGTISLRTPEAQGRVLIGMEEPGKPLAWASIAKLAKSWNPETIELVAPMQGTATPFAGPPAAPMGNRHAHQAPPVRSSATATPWEEVTERVVQPSMGRAPLPFIAPDPQRPTPLSVSTGPAPAKPSVPHSGGDDEVTRWIERPQAQAPNPLPFEAPRAAAIITAPASAPASAPAPVPPPTPPPSTPPPMTAPAPVSAPKPPPMVPHRSLAASNAAVDSPFALPRSEAREGSSPSLPSSPAPPAPRDPAEPPIWNRYPAPAAQEKPAAKPDAGASPTSLELVWFEPSILPRVRKHPSWTSLMRPPAKRPPPVKGAPPPPPDPPEVAEQAMRVDISSVLSKGSPSAGSDVDGAAETVGEGGTLEPPLMLFSGELEFPFDELETLKATVAAAQPLAASDKKLKEVLDLVGEMMKTPLQGAPEVVDGLVTSVKEAWSKANRMLPATYIDTHTTRVLLEQRHYQKREILDDMWIRALLSLPDLDAPVPAYIPGKLAKRLPLFKRFSARLIVEVLPQQDQYETNSIALRSLALARVVPPRGRAAPTR
ncbi:MAG TPA: DUF2169 domain-containing protein [Polyangiaceae bacterium]|nr:DUF2169 domain-containing protein [Polyangiaceae bacterium]